MEHKSLSEKQNHLYVHEKIEVHQLRNTYLDSHSAPVRPVTYMEANLSQLTLGKNSLVTSGVISRSLTDAIMLSMSFASPNEHSELSRRYIRGGGESEHYKERITNSQSQMSKWHIYIDMKKQN